MPCFRISRAFVIASLVASMGASVCGHRLRADEPVTDFLEELREAQYYDMALAYLSRIEKGEIAASEEVKNELLLERGETLQKAAVASRSAKERDQLLDQSEAALRKFIESQASSSRVDEARLQLATLQLVRGIQLSENPKLDDAGKKKGQALLSGAAGTYDEVVEKLRGKLKELQGQKAEDAEAIALRDTYRSQFLAAYLSAGVSRQHLADLYPKDSPSERKRSKKPRRSSRN